MIYGLKQSLFRLFHDGRILVQGYTNITSKVKTKQFAWIDSKLPIQNFVSEEFGRDPVCNFYVTSPIVTSNFAMTFPV